MEEKRRAFREMSKRLLDQQSGDRPQPPSHILIREDRDSGHGILKRSAVDILDEPPGQRLFKDAEDVESYLKDERGVMGSMTLPHERQWDRRIFDEAIRNHL